MRVWTATLDLAGSLNSRPATGHRQCHHIANAMIISPNRPIAMTIFVIVSYEISRVRGQWDQQVVDLQQIAGIRMRIPGDSGDGTIRDPSSIFR